MSDLTSLHTNDGGEAALQAALASVAEPHRTTITACFALLLQQQMGLLEALKNQPAFCQNKVEGGFLWVDNPQEFLHPDDLVVKREPLMQLIREYCGEPEGG